MIQIERNIHRVDVAEKELELLLVSDVHYDSKKCRRDLLERHFNEAKEKNALIFCFGDWFDVMGSRKDPRSQPKDIRPEYLKGKAYLNNVVEDSTEFLRKYPNFCFLSMGNHETAINKHNDYDPSSALTYNLKAIHGVNSFFLGGYSGWLLFNFNTSKTRRNFIFKIAYHHGHGGNARRSKGVLDVDLDSSIYPDAHLVVKGHSHHKWHIPGKVRYRISHDGKQIYHDCQQHLRLGSYKDDVQDGYEGWAVEKGFEPLKPGGWWVRLYSFRDTSNGRDNFTVGAEVREAI